MKIKLEINRRLVYYQRMLDHIRSFPRSHGVRKQSAQTTRDKLVAVGLQKVLESGWAATSIDMVLRECAVPKGSFYHYFASKEAFGYALLESYQAFFMRRLSKWFVDAPMQSRADLQAAMEGFLADSVAGMQRHQYQRGCLVGALGQEVASLHEGFRAKLLESLLEWEKTLSSALFASVSSYPIHSELRVDKLQATRLLQMQCDVWARDFWVAWEGAVLRSLLTRSPDALQAVVRGFLVQCALKPEPGVQASSAVKPVRKVPKKSIADQNIKSKKSINTNEINNLQEKLNF
jgi:TetR/AcrR family transcriptional regulator, transcriptional repressor for nem operon